VPDRPEKTVLIVESLPNQTGKLERQFALLGLRTLIATTGSGAIEAVQRHHPDLILLDVGLPDIDGLEVVAHIRNDSKTQRIPIVAMSIFAHMKAKCLDRGCIDFLQKPARMLELVSRVKRCLRESAPAGTNVKGI
jgi:CheY-like chemotaxis protein